MMALRKVSDRVRTTTPSADVVVLGDFNLKIAEEDPNDDRVRAIVPEKFMTKSPKMVGLMEEATTIGGANFDHLFVYQSNKAKVIESSVRAVVDFNTESQIQKDKSLLMFSVGLK